MLAREPDLASARGEDGVSAILTALYNGHRGIAEGLLAKGDQMDVFDAAALGDAKRLRDALAIDPGAVDACSADGWTPLHLAAFFGHPEIAAWLLDMGANMETVSCNTISVTPLQSALASRQEGVAKVLIDRGANVNAQGDGGFTPLHYCAANNLCDTARYLLGKRADPTARNQQGKTPLEVAREHGHHDVAALFRDEA
jgi:ankyrin repeat protein